MICCDRLRCTEQDPVAVANAILELVTETEPVLLYQDDETCARQRKHANSEYFPRPNTK